MFYLWYFWQTWAADDCWQKPAGVWWGMGITRLVIRYPRRTWHYEQVAMD